MARDMCKRPSLRDVHFFSQHAGYAPGRKLKGSLQLAQAECAADRMGWTTQWILEPDADLSWLTPEERNQPHEVYCATMTSPDGDHQATLCGIVDPDRADRRVIKAVLAMEARAYQRLQRRR
jgi:hypothetical protein